MRRREFLAASAGLAGAFVPALGGAKPCSPPLYGPTSGGNNVLTSCGGNAETDWLARSTAAGVVWAHDFRTAAEVDAFRWQGGIGNVPTLAQSDGNTRWITSDGITGNGCMEINIPTGGIARAGWWRPMSPLRSGGNGLTRDDAGANGTITPRAWNQNDVSQNGNFRTGYYGHNDYHVQFPTWQGQSNVWDGTDFYIQFRVKISAGRFNDANPGGKLMFIDVTGQTGDEEIVIQSTPHQSYFYRTYPFRMYTSFGSGLAYQSFLSVPQGGNNGSSLETGQYASTCTIGGNTSVANACWEWPGDEWVTVLVHVTPGHHNATGTGAGFWNPRGDGNYNIADAPFHDTGLEVWVARTGEKTYTKVMDHNGFAWIFNTAIHPNGSFNSICPSGYMNNVNAVEGWFHRYTQLIFSKQFIPCPQV